MNKDGNDMNIVVSGSVAFDYLMSFPGYFSDHILPEKLDSISLSFLVDSMVRQRGGNAPNIAYTLALLGQKPQIFATVGEDFQEYRLWLESKGVDTTWARVIPGVYTASFFCNTDVSNAQIASFYSGAMAHAAELSLYELKGQLPDIFVISPNDPEAMCKYVKECKELGISYIYDPSQQIVRLSAYDLREGIHGAKALFVNDYEYALIEKMTEMSLEEILEKVEFMVLTRGKDGATVYAKKHGAYAIPVIPPTEIGDPTGVGDAFRGGFLSAYFNGMDLETCGRFGALAATYCLEQAGPQGHMFTIDEFNTRFQSHFSESVYDE